jgi:transposase
VGVEVVASTLAGARRSPSPNRTRTAGYPNQRAHPRAHQEHARTLAHSTDRNDARELAHLARTGFFKPVHMKSLSAHALRSLIIGGEKTSGQRATLEDQIRGLAALLENTIRRFQSPAASK